MVARGCDDFIIYNTSFCGYKLDTFLMKKKITQLVFKVLYINV